MIWHKIVDLIVQLRARRFRRLERIAWPTLKAMCKGIDDLDYYGRSLDRLWLDGGSLNGFKAARKLGWLDYRRNHMGAVVYIYSRRREPLVYITRAGRRAWETRVPEHPNCRCVVTHIALVDTPPQQDCRVDDRPFLQMGEDLRG